MTKFKKFIFKKNYNVGCEYWVNMKDIEIQEDFEKHKPRIFKMKQKEDWYSKHGSFQSSIILNRDFVLVNGYTSYLIAEKYGLGKVPVYFVD